MRRVSAIASASFRELIRQPSTLLLVAGGVVFVLITAHGNFFALGEEARQVKQGVLAFILVAGLLAAVLGASTSVSREVRSGTALVVLSKPVGRVSFVLGKYLGLALVLGLQVGVHLLAGLLAGRMAHGVEGGADWPAIAALVGALLAGLVLAAAVSFLTRRSFVGDAVVATAVAVAVAFVGVNAMDRTGSPQAWGTGLDPRLVPAGVLILMALLALAGLALALSTRLEVVPTLASCSGVLLLGLLSDYLLGAAAKAGSRPAAWLYAVVPNWQVFWVADGLSGPEGVPWGYVARAALYGLLQVVVAFSLALVLFSDRELN